MILPALRHYLTHPAPYTGLAAVPFVDPIGVPGAEQYQCTTRNDARRYLADMLRTSIYVNRRPRKAAKQPASAVLRLITTNHEYELVNTDDTVESFVAIELYGTAGDGGMRSAVMGELVKIATGNYYGDVWDGLTIQSCQVANEGSGAAAPVDGGEDWAHQYTVELQVMHLASVPRYPLCSIKAVLNLRDVAGVLLCDIHDTVLGEGRTVEHVHWTVSDSGGVKADFEGDPGELLNATGLSGTKRTPEVDKAALSISGPVTVQAVVTDSAGETSTATVEE